MIQGHDHLWGIKRDIYVRFAYSEALKLQNLLKLKSISTSQENKHRDHACNPVCLSDSACLPATVV